MFGLGVAVVAGAAGGGGSPQKRPGYRILPGCVGAEVTDEAAALKWAREQGKTAPKGSSWPLVVVKRLFGECLMKNVNEVLAKLKPSDLLFAARLGRAALQGGLAIGQFTKEQGDAVVANILYQLQKYGVDTTGLPSGISDDAPPVGPAPKPAPKPEPAPPAPPAPAPKGPTVAEYSWVLKPEVTVHMRVVTNVASNIKAPMIAVLGTYNLNSAVWENQLIAPDMPVRWVELNLKGPWNLVDQVGADEWEAILKEAATKVPTSKLLIVGLGQGAGIGYILAGRGAVDGLFSLALTSYSKDPPEVPLAFMLWAQQGLGGRTEARWLYDEQFAFADRRGFIDDNTSYNESDWSRELARQVLVEMASAAL